MIEMSKYSYGRMASLRSFDRGLRFDPNTTGSVRSERGHDVGVSIACLLAHAANGVLRMIGVLRDWNERARQRHQLAALGDHLLRDIGIDRDAERRESSRHFWDI